MKATQFDAEMHNAVVYKTQIKYKSPKTKWNLMHKCLYTMQLQTNHTKIWNPNIMKYTMLSHIDSSQV